MFAILWPISPLNICQASAVDIIWCVILVHINFILVLQGHAFREHRGTLCPKSKTKRKQREFITLFRDPTALNLGKVWVLTMWAKHISCKSHINMGKSVTKSDLWRERWMRGGVSGSEDQLNWAQKFSVDSL